MKLRSPSVLRLSAPTISAVLFLASCASTQIVSAATGLAGSSSIRAASRSIMVATAISAVWANDGEDKVTQDELRATMNPTSVLNSVWDGTTISQFGAKNEVVSFNLVLEAVSLSATNVKVTLGNLTGPGGFVIRYAPRRTNNLFNWTRTESELFFVRYLQILGLSEFGYTIFDWDEPSIPEKLQCVPLVGDVCIGGWVSRPNHDKFYPDIAVPIELVPNFTIAAGSNQSIWADIYIPKAAATGLYTGTVTIRETGVVTHTVPVSLNGNYILDTYCEGGIVEAWTRINCLRV